MLKNLGTVEFVVIGVIAVLLFGSKRITDVAKGLGKSTKEFKKAQSEYEKTVNKDVSEEESEDKDKEVT
ncbi:twin-arginine translocase TatA/TatE family subunit [Patescibacteria group bacterium]|nr:twin-arginine translocase TatA/TatE family subunit [Patescibacteria group bacterium]MBU0777311.1 twin-arginine translocase TatA/TatE family subunit [Patescibacteria group bacterium]MBU0846109.1 twin-arginine translocase TatA/TatE family subunit [Patescibacteria group bacterium]MBU0923162.1 twin-arginine translocase TatA/TatE family subunit [Patescibacteria group bacterium]MBU1066877.1 twin-arginine translocase TatA/TatE family subunit [Patescibacteria group bacterium]